MRRCNLRLDYRTDPDGNSGARIACVVLTDAATMPGLPNTGMGGATTAGPALALGALLPPLPIAARRLMRRRHA